MEKAYSYRFYPTQEQESLLRQTLGCVRLVYNRALAERTAAWYERQERIGYAQTSSMLTGWKKQDDLQFLNEVSCVPLQQSLRHLQTAYTNFFAGRAKYPNFKKKRNGGSAEFTKSAFKWKNGKVFLAKCLEPLNIRWSRQLPKGVEPSTVTVRLNPAQQWYISLRFVDPRDLTLKPVNQAVGLDAGITSLVTLSTGEKVANPKHFNQRYQQLRQAQKALSRKQKGSRNREKARLKVARIQAGIANSRKDHLHKLTTRLIRENQTIAVESLVVKNMVKNHKLARAISDAGWGEMVRQLEYKVKWYGRDLVKVDRWFPSSKCCGNCGHVVERLPLSVREWDCPKCGTHHDRDVNAAGNILRQCGLGVSPSRTTAVAVGHTVSVCGATVRPEESKSWTAGAKKQKPKS
ncbi:IS200/IS605 family element transposase accessory protein TnpB [Desertifilum sp. FACHB-1129]|uniref:Transposase n=1 Tax=Desertifilum tharense IPPAS B-1220 TaxID=1781255 RepID=A0A1E5QI06_9CYAN|nr:MULTISPECIES: RNA-guided endonuclease TnpB family protein [Desertifilum]MBD2314013.1 IS200/IS605 family element transposase accessory protein TnpB [Desertifilum sp. FACHB-1129]MBD2320339.1 IS200/IS605 family element transposase accessory protein TnpB [Desertifilum sp. FACHB-866]MBD2330467.1 IS200/IS605 family element transposase accessory protein TnpB [Desertifilum sp. FACHB-868]OEJ74251.1 transposase [Desertifilum tharense IPPAS B-1220]